jgi:hypothetical protein
VNQFVFFFVYEILLMLCIILYNVSVMYRIDSLNDMQYRIAAAVFSVSLQKEMVPMNVTSLDGILYSYSPYAVA